MKNLVLVLIIFIFQCGQAQDALVEKITFECYCEPFEKVGVDINKELYKYETHLINHGFLKDRSGKSYIKFFENVVKSNKLAAITLDSIDWSITKADFLMNLDRDCVSKKFQKQSSLLDMAFISTTKLYKLGNAFKGLKEEERVFF